MHAAPLEYRLALDLAFASFAREDAPGAALLVLAASDPSLVFEVGARVTGPLAIVDDRTRWEQLRGGETYPCGVWACPSRGTSDGQLQALSALLGEGALLGVVVPGRLRAVVERARQPGQRHRQPWNGGAVGQALAAQGYRLERAYGLGGPRALAFALAGRLVARLGRPDLADRCEAGYRLSLAPARGGRCSLATLLLFRKGGVR